MGLFYITVLSIKHNKLEWKEFSANDKIPIGVDVPKDQSLISNPEKTTIRTGKTRYVMPRETTEWSYPNSCGC